MRDRRKIMAAAAVAVLVCASVVLAASQRGTRQEPVSDAVAAATYSADPETAKVEQIVHDYLLAHPEVLREAGRLLQERELAKVIDSNRAAFETPFGSAWAGDEKGDVVLVEFFDYACGYCRASNPDIQRLLREDKRLKVVWRELPVLGPDSVAAANVSLAAARQGKFREFHDRLFAAGIPTTAAIDTLAKTLGIAASPDYQQEIDRNFELARSVNAAGTPVFVVGDKMFQGAVGYEALKQAVAEARQRS
jgi:protein-disulfide isomerase